MFENSSPDETRPCSTGFYDLLGPVRRYVKVRYFLKLMLKKELDHHATRWIGLLCPCIDRSRPKIGSWMIFSSFRGLL